MLAELHPPLKPPDISEWIRLHYEMQHGGFISEIQKTNGGWHVRSDSSSAPMWNHSTLSDDTRELAEFLREATDYHNRHGKRPTIYVPMLSAVAETPDRDLQEAGFERFDQETWMVHALDAAPEVETKLRIEEVDSAEQFGNLIRIFNAAYQLKDQRHGAALQRHVTSANRIVHHFLGFDHQTPVCAATLVVSGTVGCIYNVGTLPTARKRGFGRQILGQVLGFARAAGLNQVFLQVESGTAAERLYTNLGFQALFNRIGYRAAAWRPVSSEEAFAPTISSLSALLGGVRSGGSPNESVIAREALALSSNVTH